MIDEGRISVNGKVVRVQGMRIDPETAVIAVDGRRIDIRNDKVTYAMNKPFGVITAMSDERLGRSGWGLKPPGTRVSVRGDRVGRDLSGGGAQPGGQPRGGGVPPLGRRIVAVQPGSQLRRSSG
jgi:hypothetical protein